MCAERWRKGRNGVGVLLLALLMSGLTRGPVLADQGADPQGAAPPAQGPARDPNDILNLDLDQLSKVDVRASAMNVEVTSVNRQESTVGRSAAAVFVITQEMIRQSACNNVPDLLRLVPGVEVARMDDHSYAITCRGFNGQFANKLLVLVDGRTVYTPIFAGVYWDTQDIPLDDIDRIEVIRGPGATVWGANAVNGVINIITKKAKDSQGAMATYGGGTEYLNRGGARVGGQIGEDFHWRISGQQFEQASAYNPQDLHDGWRQGRAGFRSDWEPDRDKSNQLTVEGDYYQGFEHSTWLLSQPLPPYVHPFANENFSGGDLLARWSHTFDDRADWKLQSSYDEQQWLCYPDLMQTVRTYDTEFQDRLPVGERHEFIWGADYRQVNQDLGYTQFAIGDYQPHRTTQLFSMFAQDEISLVDDRLSFTAGSKFERNEYSGFEFEPSGRLLFTPDKKHTFWGAISRAVRIPSEIEADGFLTSLPILTPGSPYRFMRVEGNPNLQAENLMAYELGYRAQPNERFSYDTALFYNVYENLIVGVPQGSFIDPYNNPTLLLGCTNMAHAQSYGAELSAQYKMSERWRLSGSYSYLHMDITAPPHFVMAAGNDDPPNQIRLMSSWDFTSHWRFDAVLRYVDQLPFPAPLVNVQKYITMDLQLTWQPSKHLEVAVTGRNLFDNHHYEFSSNPIVPSGVTEVERTVFAKATWRY